ncbi:AMP-binding protein [Salisaeta longa]|uniref:AMP-binding protein n=1 Tax=Salisaeta longa TaxID=503170 RepID=UPI0003B6F045|nr:AMP-binding protein [Salisaeta longa]
MIYTSPFDDVAIPDVSLPAFVTERFATWADRPALIDGPSGRTLTYGALQARIEQMAGALAARGFAPGDVFAIYAPNVPEYAIAFYGAIRAGGIVTTINPLYTADELAHQLKDADARFLLTVPPFFDKAKAAADAAEIEEVFVLGGGDTGGTSFEALLATGGAAPTVTVDPADDVAVLPYSSGTTGLPKGVMLTHRNIVANICQCVPVEGLEAGEVTVGILPFYHIYGMTVILSMALRCGATVVTMPRFEMEDFCALVQAHGIKSAYLVPPIILGLAKQPVVDDYDLSTLQYITSGAAPLPTAVAEGCRDRIGCVVKQGYGMTETSPVTHLAARGADIHKIDAVGRAVPNTEFRIVDVDGTTDVETGARGELWVRGPQVMKGYLNRPDATADTIDEAGWLHTGDVAIADEEGFVYIVDRVKELIKYKGYQVAPAELEAILQAHEGIADAAVVPSPSEEAGEVPKAFIVRKPNARGLAAEDVMAFVADQVAPYKKVRRVAFVQEIPKTASGKILRRTLVKEERAAAGS